MTKKPFVRPDRASVSEDEDDKPLVQPTSRTELIKEKRELVAESSMPTTLRKERTTYLDLPGKVYNSWKPRPDRFARERITSGRGWRSHLLGIMDQPKLETQPLDF